MRHFLIIFLLIASYSCNSVREGAASSKAGANSAQDTVYVLVENQTTPGDTLLVYFEKTPCFGRCPVYKIWIYESGYAQYEGINFTEKLGLFTTRFSLTQLDQIFESAEAIDYFNLPAEYNSSITDLPSTISQLKRDGKPKRIKARHQIPEPVQRFHADLEEILLKQAWEAAIKH